MNKALFQKYLIVLIILIVTLTNYQLAKHTQQFILRAFPSFSYMWSLSLPWIAIGIIPFLWISRKGFSLDCRYIQKNIRSLLFYSLLLGLGLGLFIALRFSSSFHAVKYPFIFSVITPIVEELIFRGWIYSVVEKHMKIHPVLGSAVLFGLHHLQYFAYRFTPFAIFQIVYTFFLGLILGKMRQKSGSIYFSTFSHMIINGASYIW
ncbi:MAG: Abortive infection protein [Microgenomates group bacterium GW2011_GWF2_45_18]|nr:MAG: Abortive infection protein [Microgenomates group bacterium GW2011_GWF1_44_10]KKU02384.1 MAG: Abortive infection protein [Microgenomates group bacterium GW2011_GWF2_45_18]OGJ41715.1 MAG: hypothetical protein A2378_02435 [Candidatus Pacebacteria bacterium RIFOXYB1_FULL_44_10]HAU99149.1 hypothetical protein [Candidatus Paceibacterota bacterium]HAX01679.1 hypothetical protein [Candidatus Paceibacterota bacterium]